MRYWVFTGPLPSSLGVVTVGLFDDVLRRCWLTGLSRAGRFELFKDRAYCTPEFLLLLLVLLILLPAPPCRNLLLEEAS